MPGFSSRAAYPIRTRLLIQMQPFSYPFTKQYHPIFRSTKRDVADYNSLTSLPYNPILNLNILRKSIINTHLILYLSLQRRDLRSRGPQSNSSNSSCHYDCDERETVHANTAQVCDVRSGKLFIFKLQFSLIYGCAFENLKRYALNLLKNKST